MLTIDMIVAMTAWPALATAGCLGLNWLVGAHRPRLSGVLLAVSAALGFVVGYWGVVGRPTFPPPVGASAALPSIAMGAVGVAVITTVTAHTRWRRSIAWGVTLLFAMAALWLLVRAVAASDWMTGETMRNVVILASGTVVAIWSWNWFERPSTARVSITSLALVAGLGAPVMLFADSLVLAQLHGSLGTAMAVVWGAVMLAPTRLLPGFVALPVMSLLWSFWVIALLFASLPVASFALLFAALPAASITARFTERVRPWLRSLVPVGVALALMSGSVAVSATRYVDGTRNGAAPGSSNSMTTHAQAAVHARQRAATAALWSGSAALLRLV